MYLRWCRISSINCITRYILYIRVFRVTFWFPQTSNVSNPLYDIQGLVLVNMKFSHLINLGSMFYQPFWIYQNPRSTTSKTNRTQSPDLQNSLCEGGQHGLLEDSTTVKKNQKTSWWLFPRNLQQDPRFTDPSTWISNSYSNLLNGGPLGFGPIEFLMDDSNPI